VRAVGGQPDGTGEAAALRRRFVVCGDNPLTYRLVVELVTRYSAEVTVVMPDPAANQGPRIAQLPAVSVVRAAKPDADAFARAELSGANALALVAQDDTANVDAALLAHELHPQVRVVIRMFNMTLGEGIRQLLDDCVVLSDAAMAAPAFVAAALGDSGGRNEIIRRYIRLPGRTLLVANRSAVPFEDVVCGLAVTAGTDGGGEPETLPDDESRADLVLAIAHGADTAARPQRRRRPLRAMSLLALSVLVGRRLRPILAALLALVLLATAGLVSVRHFGWWQALYVSVLTAFGGANPDLQAGGLEQAIQVVLTVVSLVLIPVLTAAVVEVVVNARLALAAGVLAAPMSDHVIVVGLGNVGTEVTRALHDFGTDVVAVDRDPQARGVAVARQLGIPTIIGDASHEETLRAASLATCRALLVLSTDDLANLQTALTTRAMRADARVVMRLFDDDFAERVQRAFSLHLSRSVSYLMAPAFAAATLGRDVVDTIPVGRHVLLVGELPVRPGSALDGEPVFKAQLHGETRLLGVRTGRGDQVLWSPPRGRQLVRTDHLIVVATRTGFGWLLEQTASRPHSERPPQLFA
jgi:Trk K+ transport system NAD-binding subunit